MLVQVKNQYWKNHGTTPLKRKDCKFEIDLMEQLNVSLNVKARKEINIDRIDDCFYDFIQNEIRDDIEDEVEQTIEALIKDPLTKITQEYEDVEQEEKCQDQEIQHVRSESIFAAPTYIVPIREKQIEQEEEDEKSNKGSLPDIKQVSASPDPHIRIISEKGTRANSMGNRFAEFLLPTNIGNSSRTCDPNTPDLVHKQDIDLQNRKTSRMATGRQLRYSADKVNEGNTRNANLQDRNPATFTRNETLPDIRVEQNIVHEPTEEAPALIHFGQPKVQMKSTFRRNSPKARITSRNKSPKRRNPSQIQSQKSRNSIQKSKSEESVNSYNSKWRVSSSLARPREENQILQYNSKYKINTRRTLGQSSDLRQKYNHTKLLLGNQYTRKQVIVARRILSQYNSKYSNVSRKVNKSNSGIDVSSKNKKKKIKKNKNLIEPEPEYHAPSNKEDLEMDSNIDYGEEVQMPLNQSFNSSQQQDQIQGEMIEGANMPQELSNVEQSPHIKVMPIDNISTISRENNQTEMAKLDSNVPIEQELLDETTHNQVQIFQSINQNEGRNSQLTTKEKNFIFPEKLQTLRSPEEKHVQSMAIQTFQVKSCGLDDQINQPNINLTPRNSHPNDIQIVCQILDTNSEKAIEQLGDHDSYENVQSDNLEERSQDQQMASGDRISVGVKDIQGSIQNIGGMLDHDIPQSNIDKFADQEQQSSASLMDPTQAEIEDSQVQQSSFHGSQTTLQTRVAQAPQNLQYKKRGLNPQVMSSKNLHPEIQNHLANKTFINPSTTDLRTQEMQESDERTLEEHSYQRNVHSQQKPGTSYGQPRKSQLSKHQFQRINGSKPMKIANSSNRLGTNFADSNPQQIPASVIMYSPYINKTKLQQQFLQGMQQPEKKYRKKSKQSNKLGALDEIRITSKKQKKPKEFINIQSALAQNMFYIQAQEMKKTQQDLEVLRRSYLVGHESQYNYRDDEVYMHQVPMVGAEGKIVKGQSLLYRGDIKKISQIPKKSKSVMKQNSKSSKKQ